MIVPIILYGAPVLRKHSAEVNEEDNIQEIGDSLFATLKKAEGIGLAAPQINLLKRAFVIDISPLTGQDITLEKFEGIFINPVIIDRDSENKIYREGCLSLPDIFEEVIRPEKILVRFQDILFKTHEEELDGIKARIFQHEFDHLDGVLFIDKISLLKRKILNSRLNKIKRLSKIQKNQLYVGTL
ncbi:MAG: peptide deformylase [Bacteroidetes bacterium RBG_13_42_15]|nr:MAG: peptide deformylase [Bacteroidetes bacterium RBG_13_42_15]